jgi:hypothetical protein
VPIEAGTRRQCTQDPHHKEYPRTDPVVRHVAFDSTLNAPLLLSNIGGRKAAFDFFKWGWVSLKSCVQMRNTASLSSQSFFYKVLVTAVYVLFPCQQARVVSRLGMSDILYDVRGFMARP